MRSILRLTGLALATVLFCFPASATSFSVSPVTVYVPPPGRTATITIKNHGEAPAAIQIRPFAWQQHDGKDMLNQTRDVVASPPIARVAPGAEQTIRIVRINKTEILGEEPYRLIVDEIPTSKDRQAGTVKVLLRYSIPVFFGASNSETSRVGWKIEDTDPLAITAHNRSTQHLRVADLQLRTGDGETPLREGLVGYVLPGSSVTWTFDKQLPAAAMHEMRIAGKSQHGSFDAAIDARAGR